MRRSGKAFHVGELAREYGFTDADGRRVPRTSFANQNHLWRWLRNSGNKGVATRRSRTAWSTGRIRAGSLHTRHSRYGGRAQSTRPWRSGRACLYSCGIHTFPQLRRWVHILAENKKTSFGKPKGNGRTNQVNQTDHVCIEAVEDLGRETQIAGNRATGAVKRLSFYLRPEGQNS